MSFIRHLSDSATHSLDCKLLGWGRSSAACLFSSGLLTVHVTFVSPPHSSPQTSGSVRRTTLVVTFTPLCYSQHCTSSHFHCTLPQCPHSYSNPNMTVLNKCYNILCCCIFVGRLSNEIRGLIETASWFRTFSFFKMHSCTIRRGKRGTF